MVEKPGKEQAEAAREVLREIEKAKLRIGAEQAVVPGFSDFAVNAVWMISDLAADALRRAEAAERERGS